MECGHLNDSNKLICINKDGVSLFSDFVEFETEEKMRAWLKLMKEKMGAKVWRE
jgi:hypothetical protein